MLYRKDGSEIASVLRNRICMMQSTSDDLTLHEGTLATEFGVSRTPIRQVLQKLAYERLVETRSGVGTIVSPLIPENRERDTAVLRSLFRAAAECSVNRDVTAQTHDRLVAAVAVSEIASHSQQAFLDCRTELLDITASAAPDDILADALRAAQWRHIRWSMADQVWTRREEMDEQCKTLRQCAELAGRNDLSMIYSVLADRVV